MRGIKQYFLQQNKFFNDKYFMEIIITSLSRWDGNSRCICFNVIWDSCFLIHKSLIY